MKPIAKLDEGCRSQDNSGFIVLCARFLIWARRNA
jgi:hypothetical protein